MRLGIRSRVARRILLLLVYWSREIAVSMKNEARYWEGLGIVRNSERRRKGTDLPVNGNSSSRKLTIRGEIRD